MSAAAEGDLELPLAVALRYVPERQLAPDVVGTGRGDTAQRILELAHEHGIPVRQDQDLVTLLAALDVGEEIPTELYEVVAEVLSYLYRLNESL